MNNFEEIYNRALEMLKQGASEQEVLIKFAEHKEQLAPLLSVSSLLFSIPKNIVPTPLMKRKYLAKPKSLWYTWFHIPKLAGLSMSVVLLLSAFTVMGYQASNSSPGQTLFAFKKSAENLELALTVGQAKKADLQIQIVQNRLSDAKEILNNPESEPEAKTAALTELSDQTSKAVAQVNTLANNDPKSDKNHPLLNSLDNIAEEQKKLLSEIKPDNNIKPAANTALDALNKNTEKISEIKHTVAIADSGQSTAALTADPNSVAILGKIQKVEDSKITVEETVFVLTDSTVIKDENGNIKSAEDLKEGIKVNITGTKSPLNLVADQVLLIDINSKGEVKDASTETASATKPTLIIKKSDSKTESGSSTSWSIEIDTNSAIGSFILEDPSPHFIK